MKVLVTGGAGFICDSILNLARLIKRLAGCRSPIVQVPYQDYYGQRHEDTPRRCPDISKATRRSGFAPRVIVEEGLKKTIDWCQSHYRLRPHAVGQQPLAYLDLQRPPSAVLIEPREERDTREHEPAAQQV